MRILICLIASLSAGVLAGQTVSTQQFRIAYSADGITSIKRVNDVYDTDYLAPGQTLGDVSIRYRTPDDKAWKAILRARTAGVSAPESGLSYMIGTVMPTIATSSRVTTSATTGGRGGGGGRGGFGLNALNDQMEPKNSSDPTVPRYSWPNRRGTTEWVQYDFDKPSSVSSVEVYWALTAGQGGGRGAAPSRLPKSWRVLYREGQDWKEVNAAGPYPVQADRFNHIDFDAVTTPALRVEAQLDPDGSAGLYEWRVNTSEGRQIQPVPEIQPTETFRVDGDAMTWNIQLRNNTGKDVEIGELAVPLRFNTSYSADKIDTYTKRLIRHAFIGEDGSYIFWMRTNAEGPYLVMVPMPGTKLEYFDMSQFDRGYTVFVHSAAAGDELRARGGTWRHPNTRLVLAPKGNSGDSASYGFKFRWAKDYDGVRDVLYQEGLADVNVVPGMTVPNDLAAMFSVRTRNKIEAVQPEFPDKTTVEYVGERGKDIHVYQVKFAKLGENMLKVNYGGGRYLSLEFFVTEPLETLIKKRAAFLVSHEQHKDPAKWYNGLYSQWDMKNHILRSPDDLDGLQSYAVACDDPALGKAPYLAAKNIFYPSQNEIDSLELYLSKYTWGGLQQTDQEPYPYSIYGIPNWKVNRDSQLNDYRGKEHVWRIYDYPHVILLYYNMFRIAKDYPGMVHYLDKDGYLQRAYGTAIAFFTVPMKTRKWSAYETGTYNELVIPELIQALEENGKKKEAGELRGHWEQKAEYFINKHPYLYGSEYAFDSTGFESTHALAKYAIERLHDPSGKEFQQEVKPEDAQAFLEEQMRLNLACRGTLTPAYFWLGTDYRQSGNYSYVLSYMAQMGGWAVEDYALNFAKDPIPYLRIGYQSLLSSWSLLNSGTPDSNYGFWYPGPENDGGAGGGFEPRPWGRAWLGNKEMGRGSWWYSGEIDLGFSGALRAAATVVSEDPIFGLFAYGGDLQRNKTAVQVVPKDGVRTRFHVMRGTQKFHLFFERDGLAKDQPVTFDDSLSQVAFTVENRSGDKHTAGLRMSGLPAGTYQVAVGNRNLTTFTVQAGEEKSVTLPVEGTSGVKVSIRRK